MVHAAAIPGQTETESEPHSILLLALLFGRVLGGYSSCLGPQHMICGLKRVLWSGRPRVAFLLVLLGDGGRFPATWAMSTDGFGIVPSMNQVFPAINMVSKVPEGLLCNCLSRYLFLLVAQRSPDSEGHALAESC